MNTTLATALKLKPVERLQLVEDLWDSLAATPEVVPIPAWQKAELRRRKANHLKNPKAGVTWDELKRQARARNG